MPRQATNPTATGVTLRADVTTSVDGPLTYWFDYGETSSYGSATPRRTIASEANESRAVSEPLTGLDPDTSYHYRACAGDLEEEPPRVNCSGDRTVGTVGDSISGRASVHFPTGSPPGRIVAEMDFVNVRSGPSGENPAGILRLYEGLEGPDDYEVTCFRAEGTKFTLGSRRGDDESTFMFVESAGADFGTVRRDAVGDRDPAACPDPDSGLPGDHYFVRGDGFTLRDAP